MGPARVAPARPRWRRPKLPPRQLNLWLSLDPTGGLQPRRTLPHAPSDGKAWLEATDPADQLLYGGKWSPVSIRVAITKLEQERDAARDEAAALRRQLATAKSARL